MHALEYLDAAEDKVPPVVVLYGDESFLRRLALMKVRARVLGPDDDPYSRVTLEGDKLEWRAVIDALSTRALFGGTRRLVIIENADSFVSEHRATLEAYVEKPKSSGVLLLMVDTFPSNTKLYKAVAKSGLPLECKAPAAKQLPKWLREWCPRMHGKKLSQAAADLLLDLVGPELGLLDQELAKLAVLADDKEIKPELVEEMVGGWRARTTWEMLDAAAAGQSGAALAQLDRLLLGGESPVALLAQMSWSLRRFAAATRLIVETEAQGQRPAVRRSLEDVGFKPFVIQKAEEQLRQLGRQRAGKLYRWLLKTDLDLKGDSPLTPRVILEQLIVRMSHTAAPQPVRR